MSPEEVRDRTQQVWDTFYSLQSIWHRAQFLKSRRSQLAFLLISKIYRQMYADTGIATDSARVAWSARWARWLAKPCRRLFAARPMPELEVPRVDGAGFESRLAAEITRLNGLGDLPSSTCPG
jgi:hypothetical protein